MVFLVTPSPTQSLQGTKPVRAHASQSSIAGRAGGSAASGAVAGRGVSAVARTTRGRRVDSARHGARAATIGADGARKAERMAGMAGEMKRRRSVQGLELTVSWE